MQKIEFKKILVIQNAFIGDAILGTGILEKLHQHYPQAEIYYLIRKEASTLFKNHPFIKEVLTFDRKAGKWKEFRRLGKIMRNHQFDLAITLQRFGSSGYMIWRSGAIIKAGFSKNPFSFCFNVKVKHQIGNGVHEIVRNHQLISSWTDDQPELPKLYLSTEDLQSVSSYQAKPYYTISPGSVWYTKQFPDGKWVELINLIGKEKTIYLLGGKNETELCESIKSRVNVNHLVNLAGQLSFLQSAALMKGAIMNYTNDSAPLHICSAVDAPLTAVFCSTVPEFGFGPVREGHKVVEVAQKLDCRPCGLHGHHSCPKGHFKCAQLIDIHQLV